MSSPISPPDVLFLSATVVTGDPATAPYIADVLVSSGLIKEITPPGSTSPPPHARVIEAKGHYLTPGFIDMHAHSDLYLLTHPDHEPKISQGCTVSLPNLPPTFQA